MIERLILFFISIMIGDLYPYDEKESEKNKKPTNIDDLLKEV